MPELSGSTSEEMANALVGVHARLPWQVGTFFYPNYQGQTGSMDLADMAGITMLLPVVIPNPQDSADINFFLHRTVAGDQNVKCALYNGAYVPGELRYQPTTRIAESVEVSLNGTGMTGTILSVEGLTGGRYWAAIAVDTPVGPAAQVKGVTASGDLITDCGYQLGMDVVNMRNNIGYSYTHVSYAEAFPADLTAASMGQVFTENDDYPVAPVVFMQGSIPA